MKKITGDDPYYPFFTYNENGYGECVTLNLSGDKQYINYTPGVTIRQQFAAMAMQGFLSGYDLLHAGNASISELTERSVKTADILIAELNKEIK